MSDPTDVPDLELTLPDLPVRRAGAPPRERGLTMMMDGGLPLGRFTDVLSSHGDLVDYVKFGWGTALVDLPLVRAKVDVLAGAGVGFFFGGTLLERCLAEDRPLQRTLDLFTRFCAHHGAAHVEVSDGTIDLPAEHKARAIATLAERFTVFAEVGAKDAGRSEAFGPQRWVDGIRADLAAGARYVITEARESGSAGIAHADGSLRTEVVEAITGAGIDSGDLVFEAPTKALQVDHIALFGPAVNLGNIGASDLIGLRTLRLGLRSDTLLALLP